MRRLRLLVVSSDTFPPTRVDVSVLFGVELAERGHEIDLDTAKRGGLPARLRHAVGRRRVWVGATDLGHSLVSPAKKACARHRQ